MDIRISNSGDVPIYEQIASEIKRAILSGQVKKGDPLPSIRLLAKELRVSVITTKRAYEELEKAGFIEQAVGRGTFVKVDGHESAAARQEYRIKAERHLSEAVLAARQAGISSEQMHEKLAELFDSEKNSGK